VIIGLVSFWLTDEYTYGGMEHYDWNEKERDFPAFDKITKLALESRDLVLNHEKFKEIFTPYAEAIGINKKPEVKSWDGFLESYQKKLDDKAEKERIEQEKREKARKEREE